jgi:hypothetical protein
MVIVRRKLSGKCISTEVDFVGPLAGYRVLKKKGTEVDPVQTGPYLDSARYLWKYCRTDRLKKREKATMNIHM